MYESLLGRILLNFIFFCTSLREKIYHQLLKEKEVSKKWPEASSKKTEAKEGIEFFFFDSLGPAYDYWFGAF